jgi:hypothetical protein
MPNLTRNSLVIEEEERRHQCTQRHDRNTRCRCACCNDDHRPPAPRYTHAFALRKKRTNEQTHSVLRLRRKTWREGAGARGGGIWKPPIKKVPRIKKMKAEGGAQNMTVSLILLSTGHKRI